MEAEILDIDYSNYVNLLGTAHFTKRSLKEAYEAVRRLKPTDLAVELDMERFQFLNQRCASCPDREACSGRCEFVGATDALGNVNANIWLIDMSEREIAERVRRLLPPSRLWQYSLARFPFWRRVDNEVELWEQGYKDEVLERHARRMEALRVRAPHVWRVLIDERNALMASRLAWIVTQKLGRNEETRVLALTGAAHVDGITGLLSSPGQIGEELRNFGLKFSTPRLIRRVSVN
ncbi:MAG: TraB/GumN family protein [Candidatus Bathyarchaeota archaeon]|nr:TraB/GumN family protein [Candidatus Bathyarchaeota archaeon]